MRTDLDKLQGIDVCDINKSTTYAILCMINTRAEDEQHVPMLEFSIPLLV